MPSVDLSDRLYLQLERAARTNGVSVEEFVADRLEAELEDEPFVFTPEQEAKVLQGLEDVKAGRFFTMEEVEEHLAANRAAWKAANG